MGMRPIVDVQYGDFLFLASDQIINNAAKLRYMSGGTASVPVVMRAPIGATGRGSQHAQSMERYFTGVPGLKVVAASNAYDAKGLLKSAVRDGNPVLIFEHKLLYGSVAARGPHRAPPPPPRKFQKPITSWRWTKPLCAAMARTSPFSAGSSCSTTRWQRPKFWPRKELKRKSSTSAASRRWTMETIGKSVRKTGRVVIAEEGPQDRRRQR